MGRHLELCEKKNYISSKPPEKQGVKGKEVFHLLVEGRGLPEYWLHLNAPTDVTLKDMDSFLRDIWLECCGHLSEFVMGEDTFSSDLDEEYGGKSMKVALGKVLSPGMKFYHNYDFGTTTELVIKVASKKICEAKGKQISLLARNDIPVIKCACGQTATKVCCECMGESDEGWLCNKCAKNHKCGEEMMLPVVNSPRVGMCGYTG